MALAAAVVFWYFRKPTESPVLTAIGKVLKYHLGSAAKGSILILLFKIPRLILTYLYAKYVHCTIDGKILKLFSLLKSNQFTLSFTIEDEEGK